MLLARDSARPTKNDGLGAIRFVVKGLVVLSFLVLVTGINYASTGELPALWSDGDVATISSDVAMNFYRRNLRSQDVRYSSGPPLPELASTLALSNYIKRSTSSILC